MDWEALRERTLGEVANTLVAEGVGVGAGFIGASTIGRRVEDYMLPSGVDGTSWASIIKGWAYNNAPKLAIWYVVRRYTPETPETRTQEMMMDAKKAIAGSVVFDTLLRTANKGMPIHDDGYKLLGGKGESVRTATAPQADTQRLIQENSALRTELNKALQRLAAPAPIPVQAAATAPQPVQPVQVQVQTPPVQVQAQTSPIRTAPAPVVRYQPAPARAQPPVVRVEQQTPQPAAERQRQFAFMPSQDQQLGPQAPAVSERQRRFAFMPTYNAPPTVHERERKYGFAGKNSEKEIAAMFGML